MIFTVHEWEQMIIIVHEWEGTRASNIYSKQMRENEIAIFTFFRFNKTWLRNDQELIGKYHSWPIHPFSFADYELSGMRFCKTISSW